MYSDFSSRIKVTEEEKIFFSILSYFFVKNPIFPSLACVSMVMVPRTVWRCSKFGPWNNQESSVASVNPSCQSLTINKSISCILPKWSCLEWMGAQRQKQALVMRPPTAHFLPPCSFYILLPVPCLSSLFYIKLFQSHSRLHFSFITWKSAHKCPWMSQTSLRETPELALH